MEFDINKAKIAIAALLALLVVAVAAQDDNGDPAESGAGVVERVQTAVQASAETVSEIREQVQSGAETLSEVGERVASGAETVAEVGDRVVSDLDVGAPVRAELAQAGDRAGDEIRISINQFFDQTIGWVGDGVNSAIEGLAQRLGDLVRAVALAMTVASVSFVAGMLIGISGKEKMGCAIVILMGIIVALLVAISIGARQGVIAGLLVGVVIPFAGTCLTTVLAAAAQRWMTGGRDVFAGAYHRLTRSSRATGQVI